MPRDMVASGLPSHLYKVSLLEITSMTPDWRSLHHLIAGCLVVATARTSHRLRLVEIAHSVEHVSAWSNRLWCVLLSRINRWAAAKVMSQTEVLPRNVV